MRYNPTRWVCQQRAAECDGQFYSYGDLRDCPLAGKCIGYTGKRTPYEYMYPKRLSDPQRYLEHAKRSCELRRTFLTGEESPDHVYYQKNKDRISTYYKNRYRELKALAPQLAALLPCGCDCEQCPYEEGCRYLDDEVVMAKRGGPKPSLPETVLRGLVKDQLTTPQISKLTGVSQKALRKRCSRLELKPKRAIAEIKNERK